MLNKVILMGRLTREPELRHTSSDIPVTSFCIAVDRGFGKDNVTDFINCQAWRNTAEFIYRYFGKGDTIAVSGRLQVRGYTDREGSKRVATEVVVDECYFCGKKNESGAAPFTPHPSADADTFSRGRRQEEQAEYSQLEGFEEVVGDDGNLPF